MTADRPVNERVLSKISGVIHVGANIGQERDYYAKYDLNVIWFEPNPDAYWELKTRIESFPKQTAYPFLIMDKDDATYLLHVTNGKGQASSVLDMAEQSKLYPRFKYVKNVEVLSYTLDSFVRDSQIDINQFQFLVLDTQGADLLALKGAVQALKKIQFVEVETSPLEMYCGGCLENEVIEFLAVQGFEERERTVVTPGVDNHILFERKMVE